MEKNIFHLAFLALFIVIIVLSCKKEEQNFEKQAGQFHFDLFYTNNSSKNFPFKSSLGEQEYYDDFGNFITSLTPSVFIGKFYQMGFQPGLSHSDSVGISLIAPEEILDINDPKRYADFSNNSVITLEGYYGGHCIDGYYSVDEINLKYFWADVIHFFQEVELPVQYETINISQFNISFGDDTYYSDSVKMNNILKIKHLLLIYKIFGTTPIVIPHVFCFGNTDSTYIYYTALNEPASVFNPFGGTDGVISPIIRSHKYNAETINTPQPEEIVSVKVTLSFDCNGLIQIYSGNDNIPYTNDDIFVYAPNFWERIKTTVEAN